jgi:dihydrolipoamide dehydrogenase
MTKYDIAIIGAGPGGYVAAIRAAQLGKKVCIIEKKHLGGVCLNWGCIPTKALLKTAEMYTDIQRANEFGLSIKGADFDLKKVVKRSRAVAEQLSSGIQQLLKKNKVTVLEGHARFVNSTTLEIKNDKDKIEKISSAHILISTGARPRELATLPFDQTKVLSSKEAMIQEKLPKKLLIIGSGAIGIEFASFYNAMGSEVTVVEMQKHILPAEDQEISTLAQKAFEKKGIKILTETTIEKTEVGKSGIEASIKEPKGTRSASFDQVIVAIGVVPNTEELGIENTKIHLEKNGQIKTNEFCQTAEPTIYAIGDVISPPWLAHKASHEGILAVEKICGKPVHAVKSENIPGCTYSNPQVASIGLTEAQAKDQGLKVKVGRFPFQGNGKAIAMGKPEGLVKILFEEKTGELLGAHLIGADVTELIHSLVIAKKLETTEQDLMETIFPHPTLSEMIHEATLDAFDRVIHF